MRAIGLSDLDLAARAVLMQQEDNWLRFADALITQAHAADIWRKRTGSAHPAGGTGSLYAQAALHRPSPYGPCDAAYCAALGVVLVALQNWRNRMAPEAHNGL